MLTSFSYKDEIMVIFANLLFFLFFVLTTTLTGVAGMSSLVSLVLLACGYPTIVFAARSPRSKSYLS